MSARRRVAALVGCAVLMTLAGAGPAWAGGWWRLSSRMAPTHLAPGATGLLYVTVEDVGDSAISGANEPITISDVLPAGLRITNTEDIDPHNAYKNHAKEPGQWTCTPSNEQRSGVLNRYVDPAL